MVWVVTSDDECTVVAVAVDDATGKAAAQRDYGDAPIDWRPRRRPHGGWTSPVAGYTVRPFEVKQGPLAAPPVSGVQIGDGNTQTNVWGAA